MPQRLLTGSVEPLVGTRVSVMAVSRWRKRLPGRFVRRLESLILGVFCLCAGLGSTGCTGPRSAVEVVHYRDMVREGNTDYLSDLVKALGSSSEEVRSAAVDALASLDEQAIPFLKQAVREESIRSGPALVALGKTGNPDVLSFIQEYKAHPSLEPRAIEAERAIERALSRRIDQDDLEAMEAYLEAFPESARAEEIQKRRRLRIARVEFERLSESPSVDGLEKYLADYGDTEDAPMARVTLVRLLIKEAQGHLAVEEFTPARTKLEKIPAVDPRREPEARRLIAQSHLLEGKSLRAAEKPDEALASLEKAALLPEFRLEAERNQADILMARGREQLRAQRIGLAMASFEKAARLDPVRIQEVASIKAELSAGYQTRMASTDPTERRMALVGLISLGDEAIRPMELYLGNIFAQKDYGKVDELVVAISEARRGSDPDSDPAGARVSELLTGYLKSSLVTSGADIGRLFGSPDFLKLWNHQLDPLDPRQYPLIYKVEELTSKHLGLSRVALTVRALLGEGLLDVVKGSLLTDDQVRAQLLQGQVGDDVNLPLLTRVQLAARYSGLMAELGRTAREKPAEFMGYAAGFTVVPMTSSDWTLVAEGFKEVQAKAGGGKRLSAAQLTGGLRNDRVTLVSADFDSRSLTLQVHEIAVGGLAAGTPEARNDVVDRTVAVLYNTARSAYGLYPGIDRYTVIVGEADLQSDSGLPLPGGRFEPQSRLVMTQKSYNRIDWPTLRKLNGAYGARELNEIDVKWTRWGK